MKSTIKAFFLPLMCISCVNAYKVKEQKSYKHFYKASYEETWRALQQSIMSYPLKVNNMDTGHIQTTLIKNLDMFSPPGESRDGSTRSGYRYKLMFNVVKINNSKTKVVISKDLQVAKDFFSKPKELVSDGLEELVILYRVLREIIIERRLIDATAKDKSS